MLIANEQLCKFLKAIAKTDAIEGEFRKEEHTCWIAAERIEELELMVLNDVNENPTSDTVAKLLHKIKDKLSW